MTKIIKFSTGKGDWLAVDVPPKHEELHLFYSNYRKTWCIEYYVKWKLQIIPLPTGHTYTIIGIAGELSEEQKDAIMDKVAGFCYAMNDEELIVNDFSFGKRKHTTDVNAAFVSFCNKHSIPTTSLIIKKN